MINGNPAATLRKRILHRTCAEAGTRLRSAFSKHIWKSSITASLLFNNLTEETGQQGLTFLLESTVAAGASPVLAAPMFQIDEGKLMVTAHIMRSVKEIIS